MGHLSNIRVGGLMITEGGNNGLERIVGKETVRKMERIVNMVKGKVRRSPLMMCIPKRRYKEGIEFEQEKR